MGTQVLLLRGVNVGGVRLAMQDLKDAIAAAGGLNVRTYIQSGNAAFDGDVAPGAIADALQARTGLRPELFLFAADDFRALAGACPFRDDDGAKVHLFYLARPANPAPDAMAPWVKDEVTHLTDRVLYLHAPSGIGRSALVERLPRILGVPMTARNWNTVAALMRLVQPTDAG